MSTRSLAITRQSEQAFNKTEKISSEIFIQTLHAFVRAIAVDCGDKMEVELTKVGRRIGLRLCDELLAKFAPGVAVSEFADACDVAVKVGLKVYLGQEAVTLAAEDRRYKFKVGLPGKPDFDDLPADFSLGHMLGGVIVGVLAQMGFEVKIEMKVEAEVIEFLILLDNI